MTLSVLPVDREPTAGVILLSGIPGSGKSTVAAALAERLRMAAHVEVDPGPATRLAAQSGTGQSPGH
ncbi:MULTISPECIES: adenylyl-sulfate kinase [unclassified Streptomyces]|jgi:adenylylsulfate kinase-like enzyme|uniref:adenylyl-sulfate kinase n=1 Tax=unclassified Streptomyces TaxID=2593676 RepID=UPI0029CAAB66|nr:MULTISPECIES: adenylyl-sulfate kinase [unclassified Streptomyces]